MHCAAARQHLARADDARHRPVAALHQHFRPAGGDQRGGGVLVEPGHGIHRLERGHQREPILERVHRAPRPLAEAPCRRIAVQRHQQGRAQRARTRQVRGMAAMQDVECATSPGGRILRSNAGGPTAA
jgi:hypothetical protein